MRRSRIAVLVIVSIIIVITRRYTRIPQDRRLEAVWDRWEREDRLLDIEDWGAPSVQKS